MLFVSTVEPSFIVKIIFQGQTSTLKSLEVFELQINHSFADSNFTV